MAARVRRRLRPGRGRPRVDRGTRRRGIEPRTIWKSGCRRGAFGGKATLVGAISRASTGPARSKTPDMHGTSARDVTRNLWACASPTRTLWIDSPPARSVDIPDDRFRVAAHSQTIPMPRSCEVTFEFPSFCENENWRRHFPASLFPWTQEISSWASRQREYRHEETWRRRLARRRCRRATTY